MVEGRGRLAGLSSLGPGDASELCSEALFSRERALFFVTRFAVCRFRAIGLVKCSRC